MKKSHKIFKFTAPKIRKKNLYILKRLVNFFNKIIRSKNTLVYDILKNSKKLCIDKFLNQIP